jgi:hypothetical protein
MTKKILFIGAAGVLMFSFHAAPTAHAATMSFVSSESSASVGDMIDVSVRVDSGGQSVNAAQGTIQYPANILQVQSVDHSNSIFNIWAQEPSVNTSTGAISFLGGGTNSFSGTSLYILDVKFLVKGTGKATLDLTNTGVTVGDGSGSNILDGTTPLSISVNGMTGAASTGATAVPGLPNTGAAAASSTAATPQPITRAPIAAIGLPAAPVLTVPLYPDPTRWYNLLGDTIVLWNVPADVTQVSARASHTEINTIGTPETTLSNGQDLGTLRDGIWYVTARFKNNIGWGPPAYYKISIDTAVPLPFTTQIENAGTDNPSPTITFETSDSLSGIADYTVAIDGAVIAVTASTTMTLPAQPPGAHTLVVTATDLAGNSAEDSTSFKILPLPTPQVAFVEPSVIQGNFVFASGSAIPSSSIQIVVDDGNGRDVFDGTAPVTSDGNWNITVKVPLAVGKYFLSATARDDRGAQSLSTAPQAFNVLTPSVISFGIINLSWFEILIFVILLAITGGSLALWLTSARKQRRGLYAIVAGRDIEKLSDLLLVNLKSLSEIPVIAAAAADPDLTHVIATMKANIAKMKKYLAEELGKIK